MTTMRTPNGLELAAVDRGLWAVWASDLGWRAGEWPRTVTLTKLAEGMEPDLPVEFVSGGAQVRDGDLQSVSYHSRLGAYHLIVWND